MTREPLYIRGFAAPFNELGRVGDDEWEIIRPQAFDLMSCPEIDLRLGHDGCGFAATSDGTLWVGQNAYGLIFQAPLPSDWPPHLVAGMKSLAVGASVNFINLREGANRVLRHDSEGTPYWEVTRAQIDHIAIIDPTSNGPAYRNTSCWISTWEPEELPGWLREVITQWHAPIRGPGSIEVAAMAKVAARRRGVPSSAARRRPPAHVAASAGRILAMAPYVHFPIVGHAHGLIQPSGPKAAARLPGI
jgi:hypothetical protein